MSVIITEDNLSAIQKLAEQALVEAKVIHRRYIVQFGAMNDPRAPIVEQATLFATMGFDYLDLTIEEPCASPHTTDWKHVRDCLASLHLGVVAHTGPYLPITNPSARVREAAYAELRASVDVAAFVGARVCTMHFLVWPRYQSFEDGVSMYAQELGALVAYGLSQGVQVAIENSPHNLHQLKPIRELLHRISDLKLLYDIGHGNVNTPKSLTRDYLFDLRDRLVHVHLSDNDGTSDAHLPPGTPMRGGLDIAQEIQTLQKFNYNQTVTLEIFGQRMWLKAALDFMRQLVTSTPDRTPSP